MLLLLEFLKKNVKDLLFDSFNKVFPRNMFPEKVLKTYRDTIASCMVKAYKDTIFKTTGIEIRNAPMMYVDNILYDKRDMEMASFIACVCGLVSRDMVTTHRDFVTANSIGGNYILPLREYDMDLSRFEKIYKTKVIPHDAHRILYGNYEADLEKRTLLLHVLSVVRYYKWRQEAPHKNDPKGMYFPKGAFVLEPGKFQGELVCGIYKGPNNGDNDNAPTIDDIREEMLVTDPSARLSLDFFAQVFEGLSHHGDDSDSDSDSENNSESESETDDDSNNHDEYEKSHLTKNDNNDAQTK